MHKLNRKNKLILVPYSLLLILGLVRFVFLTPTEGNAMNLKKTGAPLCKGPMVMRGAPVDPECAAQMLMELKNFSGVNLNGARCENGICIVDYSECNVTLYECRVESKENRVVEGGCKIVAPPNTHFNFTPEQKNATQIKFVRREDDMYY